MQETSKLQTCTHIAIVKHFTTSSNRVGPEHQRTSTTGGAMHPDDLQMSINTGSNKGQGNRG